MASLNSLNRWHSGVSHWHFSNDPRLYLSQAFCFLLWLALLSSVPPWRWWTGSFDTTLKACASLYWVLSPFGMPVLASPESGIIPLEKSWSRAELLHLHLDKRLTCGCTLDVYLLMSEPLFNNWRSVNICRVNKLVCTYIMCFTGKHHTVQSCRLGNCIREIQGKGQCRGLVLGFGFQCCLPPSFTIEHWKPDSGCAVKYSDRSWLVEKMESGIGSIFGYLSPLCCEFESTARCLWVSLFILCELGSAT